MSKTIFYTWFTGSLCLALIGGMVQAAYPVFGEAIVVLSGVSLSLLIIVGAYTSDY